MKCMADGGYIFKLGALDFAGGTVVHINSGLTGLIGAIIVGKRLGYGKELMAPHSLVMTYIGAALLWFGWFGFNAGSNLEATGSASIAFVNTLMCPAAAATLLAVRGMADQGQAEPARSQSRVSSRVLLRSRRLPVSPASAARSSSASSPAWSATSSARP
jgi:ammonia channel protein AmtB